MTQEIYHAALRLYDGLGLQRARLRLVGVRVEGLMPRADVHRQLRARRAGARLVRGRPGRRPGAAAVRLCRRPAGRLLADPA